MQESGGLPGVYQQIEYIASSGIQCIDTGIIPTSNTDVLLKTTSVSGSYLNFLFGAGDSSPPQYGVSAVYFNYLSKFNQLWTQAQGNQTVAIVGGKLYVNDVLQLDLSDATTPLPIPSTLAICCRTKANNGYERFATMRIYSFKMWESNVIIRDFIPCIRIIDSKPGLYDMVTNTFYTNAGTGEFIVPA